MKSDKARVRGVRLAAALAGVVAWGGPVQPALAEGGAAREARAGVALCLPGADGQAGAECQPLGPAEYHDQMKETGITLPFRALPAHPPDPELSYVRFNYAQVVRPGAAIYASLEDAARQKNPVRKLEAGFDFISYSEIAEVKGGRHFRLRSGEWMYGGDLSRVSPPRFQGLELTQTPSRPFGWILYPTETKHTPGYEEQDYTDRRLERYDLVQIYGEEQVGDYEWYLVAPGEWIEQRLIARVLPNSRPPQGVENGRWIEINLFEQTVAVYQDHQLVFATLTSSGLPGWWTRPGLFQVYIKLNQDTMRGAFEPDRSDYYYLQDVPWTMYFDESRALHGAYWHNGFGYPRSHGCVNLAPGDARWIFDWVREGDWVYVWDPSGRTPVDPDVYSAGGA